MVYGFYVFKAKQVYGFYIDEYRTEEIFQLMKEWVMNHQVIGEEHDARIELTKAEKSESDLEFGGCKRYAHMEFTIEFLNSDWWDDEKKPVKRIKDKSSLFLFDDCGRLLDIVYIPPEMGHLLRDRRKKDPVIELHKDDELRRLIWFPYVALKMEGNRMFVERMIGVFPMKKEDFDKIFEPWDFLKEKSID